jgi:hypothetical protein
LHNLKPGQDFVVYENAFELDSGNKKKIPKQRIVQAEALHGVAPQCQLASLKVLDSLRRGQTSDIIRALSNIREDVNGDPKFLRIHGVNLSLGYEFDVEMFACGQSPLCIEVDRLVRTGVVVVVAAGNTGYAQIQTNRQSDHTARVWNAATGQLLDTLVGHTNRVNCAEFSPDGRRVVTASSDQTARVWNLGTGQPLAELEGHTSSAYLRGVLARLSAHGRRQLGQNAVTPSEISNA